ncbi:hypothetical protein [Mycobacterium sp. 852002-10029_SCH5224772]|uniref:hypothetical protein n=1 Tax=Mycobacterium sp. 852002-10029_SCH5224772 TaxID=1834083 RepID=UPI000ADFBF44|nr:hypothetical protein [Mycobacterium sp. 852002-10029_SCH5224772]
MLNAAYGMLAMLPVTFWVARDDDGVVMTASRPSPITESASQPIDIDPKARRAGNGELAIIIQRLRAKRSQKRREQREFEAWLQITANPLR